MNKLSVVLFSILLLGYSFSGKCAYQLSNGTVIFSPFYDSHYELFNLTNFSKTPVTIDGVYYPTTEHYFQAQKFIGPPDKRKKFLNEVKAKGNSPMQALDTARKWTANWTTQDWQNWDNQKEKIMEKALRAKLKQHPQIASELMGTGNSYLVEDTGPRDEKEWGWGADGTGSNKLGILWMRLRNELFKAKGMNNLIVDPNTLYVKAQKERKTLGRRTSVMQKWPEARYIKSGQAKPGSKSTQVNNLFDLSTYAKRKLKLGQHIKINLKKESSLTYGISARHNTFYIRGKDNRGAWIDVYIKGAQIYENGRPVTKSGFANWAIPIVKQDLDKR